MKLARPNRNLKGSVPSPQGSNPPERRLTLQFRRARAYLSVLISVHLWLIPTAPSVAQAPARLPAAALVFGDTFTIDSKILGETRRINVYMPPGYAKLPRVPVLYMPDGGMAEDFLHVAGLVQVSVSNGTMRPFLLVGIENTERRRDLTGPTENEVDRKTAPRVGGSAAFRKFLREELMPQVKR